MAADENANETGQICEKNFNIISQHAVRMLDWHGTPNQVNLVCTAPINQAQLSKTA